MDIQKKLDLSQLINALFQASQSSQRDEIQHRLSAYGKNNG